MLNRISTIKNPALRAAVAAMVVTPTMLAVMFILYLPFGVLGMKIGEATGKDIGFWGWAVGIVKISFPFLF